MIVGWVPDEQFDDDVFDVVARAGTTTDQRPACQKQRHPPPLKTIASKRMG
jgi:hypothetical protein